MAKFLLDTTVLIDHLRGQREVVELLLRLTQDGHLLGVCAINVAELYAGLSEPERLVADELVDNLDFFPMTRGVAKNAGILRHDFARRGRTLHTADLLVASTALAEEATLITANVRDFPIDDLEVRGHPPRQDV